MKASSILADMIERMQTIGWVPHGGNFPSWESGLRATCTAPLCVINTMDVVLHKRGRDYNASVSGVVVRLLRQIVGRELVRWNDTREDVTEVIEACEKARELALKEES